MLLLLTPLSDLRFIHSFIPLPQWLLPLPTPCFSGTFTSTTSPPSLAAFTSAKERAEWRYEPTWISESRNRWTVVFWISGVPRRMQVGAVGIRVRSTRIRPSLLAAPPRQRRMFSTSQPPPSRLTSTCHMLCLYVFFLWNYLLVPNFVKMCLILGQNWS